MNQLFKLRPNRDPINHLNWDWNQKIWPAWATAWHPKSSLTIAPENGWLEYDRFLLGPGLFSGANCLFQGGYKMGLKSSMTIWWLMPRGKLSEKKGCSSYKVGPVTSYKWSCNYNPNKWPIVNRFHWGEKNLLIAQMLHVWKFVSTFTINY